MMAPPKTTPPAAADEPTLFEAEERSTPVSEPTDVQKPAPTTASAPTATSASPAPTPATTPAPEAPAPTAPKASDPVAESDAARAGFARISSGRTEVPAANPAMPIAFGAISGALAALTVALLIVLRWRRHHQ